jgi:SAM-dependent methyltransferase
MTKENLFPRALSPKRRGSIDEGSERMVPEPHISRNFHMSVPDYSKNILPLVFSSMLCRQQHFYLPLYTYWSKVLGHAPRFHRKQWEFVYICQVLYERGFLKEGMTGLGFGVGKEPLVSFFASCGVRVLATDLDFTEAEELGWTSNNQHSDDLSSLNERLLCDSEKFDSLVSFRNVNMNQIPGDIGAFDYCWSSCAFEHLGSIRKGLDFVKNSAKLLKPGGVAVHTTEYNISSNSQTLDNNSSLVIFRRCDIELLADELKSDGFEVEPIDFLSGEDELERYIDLPPYIDEPHLRLLLEDEYIATSLGIIVRAPGALSK